jgi:hypothetical protein
MSDIVDAEILPDETEPQALARVERAEVAVLDGVVVDIDLPGGRTSIAVTHEDAKALKAGQLYIGFYNLSGMLPDREDFEGLTDKSDQERREMGLPPRRPQERLHKYLPDPTKPFMVSNRVALAPIHKETRGRWYAEKTDVLNVRLTWEATAWVTHFAIGTRKDGILFGGQLNQPLAVKPGNGLKFAIKLADVARASLLSGNDWPSRVLSAAEAIHAAHTTPCEFECDRSVAKCMETPCIGRRAHRQKLLGP